MLRGDQGARQKIGQHHQACAEQDGGGQGAAVIRADQQAGEVRCQQADKADAARSHHGQCGGDGGQQVGSPAQSAHVDAERHGAGRATGEDVEITRPGQDE